MSVINSIPLIAAGDDGYQISRSVRTRSSATGYFSRTPAGAGNRRTWTWSGWVKLGDVSTTGRCLFGTMVTSSYTTIGIDVSGQGTATIGMESVSGTTTVLARVYTNAVLRDPSAWYHIVVAIDTTNATSTDRFRIYINGVRMSVTEPIVAALNTDHFINQASVSHGLMAGYTTAYCMDGYIAEVNFIDGQALTPSSFGENDTLTGVWKPKKYAGTYGTNGFYLNFSDNSAATAAAIGKDYSGNGNNWTPNNISVTSGVTYDSMLDTPTPYADGGNGRGNYAVLNPLGTETPSVSGGTSNGNLTLSNSGSNQKRSTIIFSASDTNKYYWEVTVNGTATGNFPIPGVSVVGAGTNWPGYDGNSIGLYQGGGLYYNGSLAATLTSFANGDVINIAYDIASGKIWFGKNGTWMASGVPSTGTSPNYTLPTGVDRVASGYTGSGYGTLEFNFGQRPFAYTPPTGFKALNTQNLPDSTIKKGSAYFDVSTWTGDGVSPKAVVSSLNFQPDLVWAKSRSSAYWHNLYDSSRGASNGLFSNSTFAETVNPAGYVSSFNSNGFSVTQGGTSINDVNQSGQTYVGWQWKKGATPGFDIVTYTGNGSAGQAISHSLGVTPKMMIVKPRATPVNSWNAWMVYHASLSSPTTSFLRLNETSAVYSGYTAAWNSTAPTSTNFTVGYSAGSGANGSGDTFVAYLFSEVAGFSKFGSYTGNGSTDGPFVYLGFRPRYVMIKRTDTTADWEVIDTARDTYNAAANYLYPDTSAAEANAPSNTRDYLSNGFKIRHSGAGANASGGTYIYAAFAENPFKNSLAR